jgi:glucosamine-6-phosphate deaminase
MADAAARHASASIRAAIERNGAARIVAATGSAQFEFLALLTGREAVDWSKVEMFHLDEYIGLSADHLASFRKFLTDHLIAKSHLSRFHLLDGEADPQEVCLTVGRALQSAPIDVAFIGIGENGHLAFNDPPADFETQAPYLVVSLDEACRRQQVGEGWFATLADVPKQAISMSVRQILSARELIGIVPESRKAQAVQAAFEGPITPALPASILRTHDNAVIYLDRQSSALLAERTLEAFA